MDTTEKTEKKDGTQSIPQKKKKLVNIITTSITLAVSLLLIVFIIVQVSGPYAGIKVFGFKTYLISDTGSMEPMLKKNDFIVVKKSDFNKLEEGDIITFMGVIVSGGKAVNAPVTHKIIEVIEEDNVRSYRTQGINKSTNPVADARLVTINGAGGTNKYIGEYAFKVPALGAIIAFIKSPFGIGTIIVNIIIIAAIVYILKSKDDPKEPQTPEKTNIS